MEKLNKVYKALNDWRGGTINPLCDAYNNIMHFEGEREEFKIILRSDKSIKIYRRDLEPFANWDNPGYGIYFNTYLVPKNLGTNISIKNK